MAGKKLSKPAPNLYLEHLKQQSLARIDRSIPERIRETGPPNPALTINSSDHLELNSANAVQLWRLKQMMDEVFAKIPNDAFIVGFEFKIAIDVDGKPLCKSVAMGQFCDEPPIYPNVDQCRSRNNPYNSGRQE